MKKLTALFLTLVLLCALLTGCGSSVSDTKSYGRDEYYSEPSEAYAEDPASYEYSKGDGWNGGSSSSSSSASSQSAASQTADPNEKIVYTADASIETLEFDKTMDTITALLERCGGYIQRSSLAGGSYQDTVRGTAYRSASLTVRVPSENFAAFTEGFGDAGTVLYVNTSQSNITQQYFNTKTRLDALNVEHARLLEFLAQAETVSDMLEIESRLSEIEWQIDSYTTSLQGMQRDVDYSTVTIRVQEVEKITEIEPAHQSYWEKTFSGLKATISAIGEFFTELFSGIIIILPILVLFAIIAVVVILIIRRHRRKKAAKAAPVPPPQDGPRE